MLHCGGIKNVLSNLVMKSGTWEGGNNVCCAEDELPSFAYFARDKIFRDKQSHDTRYPVTTYLASMSISALALDYFRSIEGSNVAPGCSHRRRLGRWFR